MTKTGNIISEYYKRRLWSKTFLLSLVIIFAMLTNHRQEQAEQMWNVRHTLGLKLPGRESLNINMNTFPMLPT